MDLSYYDEKHVRIRDIYGDTFTGLARYANSAFLECEYGGDEDGVFIEDVLIYNSQVASIEEIEVHGTVELWTQRLILRRYCPEDADALYHSLGTDPAMSQYTGWNPYASPEQAQETVDTLIGHYDDVQYYSWVMEIEDVLVGTIGAYDVQGDSIEVGFSVVQGWQGRGLATEALRKVLQYLTENEGFACVTAWCASENIASKRVLEKAGMMLAKTEKGAIMVGSRVFDKLIFEYRR